MDNFSNLPLSDWMITNNHPIRKERMALSGVTANTKILRASQVFRYYLMSSALRFGRIHDIIMMDGMRRNLWLSACLVRGFEPVRWEFFSENLLGTGVSLLFVLYVRVKRPTPNPSDSAYSPFSITTNIIDISSTSTRLF